MIKSDFSPRIVKLMQNRQALIQITREQDRKEIYKIVYGDYIWNETSGNLIKVTKQHIDLNDLSRAVDLTNYFASQYLALKQNRLQEFLSMEFHAAIYEFYDREYFGGVSVEINSPGFFGRTMKDIKLAGYVSAMLALSAAGITAQEAKNLHVQNSANKVVSICDIELEADLRETMEMYANIHLWENDVCPRRQAARDSVGLKSDVTVRVVEPEGGI